MLLVVRPKSEGAAKVPPGKADHLPAVYFTESSLVMKQLEIVNPSLILMELPQEALAAFALVNQLLTRAVFTPLLLSTDMAIEPWITQNWVEAQWCSTGKENGSEVQKHWLDETLKQMHHRGFSRRLAGYILEHECNFIMENDQAMLSFVIPTLQEELIRSKFCGSDEAIQIGLALREAAINGIVHGNLDISSQIMDQQPELFYALIQERRSQAPYNKRSLFLQSFLGQEQVEYRVRDEGSGFDVSSLANPTDPENMEKGNGRGILLIRSLMDEVAFNELGNQITMSKRCNSRGEESI
jgi:hypothetical protein